MTADLDIAADVAMEHAEWARADVTLVKRTLTSSDGVFDDATVTEVETTISGVFTPNKKDLAAVRAGGVVEEYDELRVLPDMALAVGDDVIIDGVRYGVKAAVPAYQGAVVVETVARLERVTA